MSGDSSLRDNVRQMVDWFEGQLKDVGVETTQVDLGWQDEAQTLKLPNVILGRIGKEPKNKTVLVYGHMDVQPVRLLMFPTPNTH